MRLSRIGLKPLAFLTAVGLIALFTTLLIIGRLGELSYVTLCGGTLLLSLVLPSLDRLLELDIKNLKVVLKDIQQAKNDLFEREQELKAVIILMMKVLSYAGAAEGRFSSMEYAALRRRWYMLKTDQLSKHLKLSQTESKDIVKYADIYKKMDAVFEKHNGNLKTTDPDYENSINHLKQLERELFDLMEADLQEKNNNGIQQLTR